METQLEVSLLLSSPSLSTERNRVLVPVHGLNGTPEERPPSVCELVWPHGKELGW